MCGSGRRRPRRERPWSGTTRTGSASPFIWYVEKARDVLRRRDGGPDEGWLWIGRRGCRMQDNDISQRVARVTTQRLGRTISPHMFRDCVATDIAIHDPQHVGITKAVLGHATLASSQKYYNQAGSFAASGRTRP